MPTAKLSGLVNHLGHSGPEAPGAATDGELLTRFANTRDEAAFAELVRRHARLVFGVCRRVTGNHHLAEDAFQAVFVVLAAKAAVIRPPSAVAGWLYGVAYRTALRARTVADRRRRREASVGTVLTTESPVSAEHSDAVAMLDEEIARLPENYRNPVVLCELEGHSRKEAARRLGIAEGTLSSRLAAARKALAERLRQRGIALSAAGLSAVFAQIATANPPAALTAKAATATAPELVPAPVAALSHGVIRIMFLDKLKTTGLFAAITLGMCTCAAFALAAGLPASPPPPLPPRPILATAADPPTPATVPAKADPKPLPKGPNKILLYHSDSLVLIDPDGKNEKQLPRGSEEYHPTGAMLSPDGKQVAVLILEPLPPDDGVPGAKRRMARLHVRGIDEKGPGTDFGVCQMFSWSPDGSELVCGEFDDAGEGKSLTSKHWIVNVKTKEKTELKIPADHIVTDWLRDGNRFLTTQVKNDPANPLARLYLMNRDGTEHKTLTGEKQFVLVGRMSPDGKRVLCMEATLPKDGKVAPGSAKRVLTTLDLTTGNLTPVADFPLNGEIQGYCWSPDGKRIAYAWREIHEGKPEDLIEKETESHLVVCDADGKNQKTIVTEKGKGQWHITIGQIDWR